MLGLILMRLMPKDREVQIIATAAGCVSLVGLVTGATWLVSSEESFAQVALVANAGAGLTAIAAWSGMLSQHNGGGTPETWAEWLAMFLVASVMSALFVFIDCGHHLPKVLGGTECNGHPGITVVWTVAALAMAAISLPSAIRAWLLSTLSSKGGRERGAA
jgi:hypothetical protein